jgi:hypothetical protein
VRSPHQPRPWNTQLVLTDGRAVRKQYCGVGGNAGATDELAFTGLESSARPPSGHPRAPESACGVPLTAHDPLLGFAGACVGAGAHARPRHVESRAHTARACPTRREAGGTPPSAIFRSGVPLAGVVVGQDAKCPLSMSDAAVSKCLGTKKALGNGTNSACRWIEPWLRFVGELDEAGQRARWGGASGRSSAL